MPFRLRRQGDLFIAAATRSNLLLPGRCRDKFLFWQTLTLFGRDKVLVHACSDYRLPIIISPGFAFARFDREPLIIYRLGSLIQIVVSIPGVCGVLAARERLHAVPG